MTWSFDNDRPIYLQIMDELIIKIISKEYPAGTQLPPVRELAAQIKVNPNTLQRSFAELENLNIIHTQRTNGRFVTDDEKLLNDLRNNLANTNINNFFSQMEQLGFSNKEIFEYLNKRKENE
ncbi:GntR family transcriptional regulator [Bacilli bacterium PM5-3]|nr:GntR family transcriptional regulator [Bacilli bacterium PM5-3]MDH6603876.1 GntR family transcriptional regulator [Bacilli bacterium PM5-9]